MKSSRADARARASGGFSFVAIGLALCLFPSPVRATPYWVAWEGDDYPENQGWTRDWGDSQGEFHGTGAIRTIHDGMMTSDGTFDASIYDFNYIDRPGAIDPTAPGEVFVMQWRLRVEEIVGYHRDPSVSVFSDAGAGVSFEFGMDSFRSVLEGGATFAFAPAEFHFFELRSTDMAQYALFLDGTELYDGEFIPVVSHSWITWGDGIVGSGSRASWDYFRVGVTPEPSCLLLVLAATVQARRLTRRQRFHKGSLKRDTLVLDWEYWLR